MKLRSTISKHISERRRRSGFHQQEKEESVPPPYSILYVDDDTDLLELGKSFLESTQEFTVETSDSAKKAQALLRQHRPDAIVSDYEMPEINGIVFLKHVRAEYGDLPFIIFTGRGREDVVIDALNNGADFYLQKGSDAEAVYAELRHMLRRAIQMRQAQLTLAEQEQRFHDLQNSTDMIQSVDPQGRFLFTNKKWQDTLGYSREDLATITLFDIIHEDSREHCMQVFPRVLSGDDVGIIDVAFRARDGRKVYAEGFASCRIIDGKPQYTRGIFKDVTDRKRAEQALKESEEKFRTLVEHSLDGIIIVDLTGGILFANLAAGKLIEMEDYHEVIGRRNVMEFITPESKDTVLLDFRQVAQGIDGFLAQYRVITSLRRIRWVESIGKAITFDGKQAILISLRDITGRKEAESIIRENEEKFRSIFETSPFPIAINTMPDQKFLAVNPAFIRVSGYTEDEILGKNPVELGLLSFTETAKLVSRAVLAGKIENVPLALTVKGGKRVQVLFSTVPMTISGRSASLTLTVEVTQLKRVEEELIRKNEDLSAAYEELSSTEEELRENYEQLHQREQALRESEEKYRLLTESSPDVIYLMDRQGIITHISPQITRYGYTREDVISHNFTEFIDKEDIPRAVADMTKTLTTGQSTVIPVKMHDKAGNIIWMEDNGAAIRNASGEVTGISGILRDITARTATEEALRESEEKFRALVENSLDGFFIVSFTGTLLFANPAAGRIVDLDDYQSAIGKLNVMEFVAPESKPAVLKDFAQVAIGIDAYMVYYKLITARKREVWVECLGKKIAFMGSPAMLVSMRDITERHKAEETLQESETRLATIFRSSPVALTLVSATDGRFVDVNDAFVANTGYSREEVIGRTSEEIGIFTDSTDYARMASAIRGRQGVQGVEIRCRIKDGTTQTCRFHSTVVLMNNRPHVLSNIENITSRRQMEEAILRTNKQLSLLSSITRHDVLNKIAIIQGHIALVQKKGKPEDYVSLIGKITPIISVIRQQVEFTRVYQNLGIKEPEWQKVSKALSPSFIPKSIRLTSELGDLEIFGDLMLERVFHNLIDNSLRHGERVTEIRLAAKPDPDGLTITYEDNGIGIPENEKEKIFERGYGKNTGLGLFLAREILAITGITIRETGEAGTGARFEIHVPESACRNAPV